jgi:hypothetical protein
MKTLKRNKQTLYYALFEGKEEIKDENGYRTGEHQLKYLHPIKARMNISAAKGTAESEMFGISLNYTKTLVTDDIKCPIKEDSILWIDATPDEPYNYIVVQVAKSLNSISYAVKKVDIS